MAYKEDKETTLNFVSMKLDKIHEQIELLLESGMYHPGVLIVGKVGVGKTEGLKELANRLKIGHKELRVANYQETDFVGLPSITTVKDVSGTERKVVEWIQQGFLPDPSLGDPEEGILVLDELLSAPKPVQAALLQLLDSSRSIGSYKLPPKWLVVGCGNGPNDGGYYAGVGSATYTRLFCARVDLDSAVWFKWAYSHGVHPAIIGFLKYKPDSLWKFDPNTAAASGEVFPTPRGWTNASMLLRASERKHGKHLDYTTVQIQSGVYVGDPAGTEFAAYYMLQDKIVDIDDVREGKVKYGKEFAFDRSNDHGSLMYLQMSSITSALCHDIPAYMDRSNTENYNNQNVWNGIINLMRFGLAMSTQVLDVGATMFAELAAAISKDWFMFITMHGKKFSAACPEYDKFYNENSNLFSFRENKQ